MTPVQRNSFHSLYFALILSLTVIILMIGNGSFLPKLNLTVESTNRDPFQLTMKSVKNSSLTKSLPRIVPLYTPKKLQFVIANKQYFAIQLGNGGSEIRITDATIRNYGIYEPIFIDIKNGTFHDVSLINFTGDGLDIITKGNDPYVVLARDFKDLTNINPVKIFFLYLSTFFACTVFFFFILNKFIYNKNPKYQANLLNIGFGQALFWLLIIFIVDYTYPIIFTPDSAKYLELSRIIGGNLPWQYWDKVRGFAFPLLVRLIEIILGNNNNAFNFLYSLLHWLLFCSLSSIVITRLSIRDDKEKIVIRVLLFFLVVLDPIVFGYSHAVLTEAVAASLLAFSVLVANKILENALNGNSLKGNIKYFLYFCLVIPFSWSLKQPYLLTTLVPLLVSIVFLLIRLRSKRAKALYAIYLIFTLLLLGISINSWNMYLQKKYLNNVNRTPEEYINRKINENYTQLKASSSSYFLNVVNNYLAISNILYYDVFTQQIDTKRVTYIGANENDTIAYRLFTPGVSNSFPMSSFDEENIQNLKVINNAPTWENNYFNFRTVESNFLFSILYLYLPFVLFFFSALAIIFKGRFDLELIIIWPIISIALLNSLRNNPIDRYSYPGYPLLLTLLVLYVYAAGRKLLAYFMHIHLEAQNDEA